jgi:PAS domain S-box-containing protein
MVMEPAFLWNGLSGPLLDTVNVWLNVYDREMNLIFWNKTAERISGFPRIDVLDNNDVWTWLYPDEVYRTQVMSRAGALLEAESEVDGFETNIRCKDGSEKTLSWSSRTIVDDKGEIRGAITFGRDVTDRKQAEEALQRAHNELSVVYNVASVTSGAIDLETILKRSLEQVLPALKANKGIIHLWDEENHRLRLGAYQGLAEASVSELGTYSTDTGIIGRVFETERPIALPNILAVLDDAPVHVPSRMFNAYLGVPMRAKGKLLGVFSVLGKAERRFTNDEIHLVTAVADQIGVAVENARLYQQSQQLAVSEERRRLARELHDAITQSLYSLTLFAEAGRRSLNSGNLEDTELYLTDLGETAQHSLREMRLLLHELRPLCLESEGMLEAIQQRLDSVERRVGIKALLQAECKADLPAQTEQELYRIIQEALNNALRHASAQSVSVTISEADGRLVVRITDDGVGFDLERAYNQGGIGLESMSERARSLQATFRIDSADGDGTTVTVTLPITGASIG